MSLGTESLGVLPLGVPVPQAASGPYVAPSVYFDGTNDFLYLPLPNNVATVGSSVGTISFWIKLNSPPTAGVKPGILLSPGGGLQLQFDTSGLIELIGMNTSGTRGQVLIMRSASQLSVGIWHHVALSWDITVNPSKQRLYVDGASDWGYGSVLIGGVIDVADKAWNFSLDKLNYYKIDGCFADVWADFGHFIDLDVPANLEKFRDPSGRPVDLGADGSAPTGTQPPIYLHGNATTFANNAGYGGAFTVYGNPTDCPTSPSGGGATHAAAITLAQSLGAGVSNIATLNAGVTLATSVGVSDGGNMSTTQQVMLAQTLGQAQSAAISQEAAITYALSLAESASPQALLQAQLALAQSMGAANDVVAALEAQAGYSITLSQSQAAAMNAIADTSLGLSLGLTHDLPPPGSVSAALTLAAAYGVTPAASADLAAAVAYALQPAAVVNGGLELAVAINLALNAGMGQSALITIEGGLSLALSMTVADSVAADFAASLELGSLLGAVMDVAAQMQADTSLGLRPGASYTGGGVTEAGVTYSVTLSQTAAGATFDATIVTPDGRKLTIRADDRLLTIAADTRTLNIQ